MRFIRSCVIILSLFVHNNSALAQEDSATQDNDSMNGAILKTYTRKIDQIEQQRRDDSLEKTALEAELKSLKTTDNLKKEELQKKLATLKDKDAQRLIQKKAQIDSLRATAKGFPVIGFFDDTLFLVYNKLGSFSAAERAEAVSNRIHSLGESIRFHADSLRLSATENTVDLVFGEKIITSVSENDALWNNTSMHEQAERYKNIIGSEISRYKSETSFSTVIKDIGLALLVIGVISLLIFYFGRLFRWTASKIHAEENKRIRGIAIKNYTLFDAKRQVNFLLKVNTVLKWFVILLAIYLALPILFGIFPWTKNFAQVLIGYILDPVKHILVNLWNFVPNIITIVVIIIVFRYVL
ncbi:MAG: hypothetical protein ABIO82_03815, partial [Ginsengibacter sp.]